MIEKYMNKTDCLALAKSSLDSVFAKEIAQAVSNSRILITGASGFVGKNLLYLLQRAREGYDINFDIDILRKKDAKKLYQREKSVKEIVWAEASNKLESEYDFVFHLANDSADFTKVNFELNQTVSFRMLDFLYRTLRLQKKYCSFVLASSGAVYGTTLLSDETDLIFLEERELSYSNLSSYGKGKLYCEEWASGHLPPNLNLAICRMFSFYGPHLPTNLNFAVGNFYQDALLSRPLLIKGSGKSVRSFLSSYDLALALLLVATRKFSGPINIGGSHALQISDLAKVFCDLTATSMKLEMHAEQLDTYYVPKTRVLNKFLGFNETITINEGISHWLNCGGLKGSL